MKRKAALALAAVGAAGVFHGVAQADTTWTGAVDTNQETAGNWSGGRPGDGSTDTVFFDSAAPASFARTSNYGVLGGGIWNVGPAADMSLRYNGGYGTVTKVGAWHIKMRGPDMQFNVTTPHTITVTDLWGYRAWNAPAGTLLPTVNVNLVAGSKLIVDATNAQGSYVDVPHFNLTGSGTMQIGSTGGLDTNGNPTGGAGQQHVGDITSTVPALAFVGGSYNRVNMWGTLRSATATIDLTQADSRSPQGVRFFGGTTSGISPGVAVGQTGKLTFNGAGSARLEVTSGSVGTTLTMDVTNSSTAGTTFDQLDLTSSVSMTTGDLSRSILALNVADYGAGGTPVSVKLVANSSTDYSAVSAASFSSVTGLPTGATISGDSGGNIYLNYLEAPVPEPAALGLLSVGAIGLLMRRQRRQT